MMSDNNSESPRTPKERPPPNLFPEHYLADVPLPDPVDEEEGARGNGEDVHDQLPSLEQYKMDSGHVNQANYGLWWCVFVLITLLVGSALVGVGISIGRDEGRNNGSPQSSVYQPNNNAPAPSTPSTSTSTNNQSPGHSTPGDVGTPQSRASDAEVFVSQAGWTDLMQVTQTGSPQNKAAEWIADIDPLNLPMKITDEMRERYALAVFYYALNGDDWPDRANDNWLTAASVCDWNSEYSLANMETVKVGVECHDVTQTVKSIYLPALQIKGFLRPEIALLKQLRSITLSHNLIQNFNSMNALPPAILKLIHLEEIVLDDNILSGQLPSSLPVLPALRVLNLSKNRFAGPIPLSYAEFSTLHTLNLENNQLDGSLAPLKGLANVQAILLGRNQLSGSLDDEVFSTWTNIQALDVSNNELSGKLPKQLFALSSLGVLDLSDNLLSGVLPDLVSINSNVKFLALQNNNFTGPLGPSLAMMEQLQHLDVSNNFFTGTMPTEFGRLQNLRYLFMAFNPKLAYGAIPTEYGSLPQLVDLSLQSTNRVKKIPTELGNLSKLFLLDLNNNLMTGTIPTELGKLGELRFLFLQNNKMEGNVPLQLRNCRMLQIVLANGNFLTGNLNFMCQLKQEYFLQTMLVSRCQTDLTCECCICCTDQDNEEHLECSKENVWFPELDPVNDPSYSYQREFYAFVDQQVLYQAQVPKGAAPPPPENINEAADNAENFYAPPDESPHIDDLPSSGATQPNGNNPDTTTGGSASDTSGSATGQTGDNPSDTTATTSNTNGQALDSTPVDGSGSTNNANAPTGDASAGDADTENKDDDPLGNVDPFGGPFGWR